MNNHFVKLIFFQIRISDFPRSTKYFSIYALFVFETLNRQKTTIRLTNTAQHHIVFTLVLDCFLESCQTAKRIDQLTVKLDRIYYSKEMPNTASSSQLDDLFF